jgi:hypothetical protein
MKILRSWMVAIVVLVSIILGCTKGGDDFYPLAVGNMWFYADSYYAYDTIVGTRYVEIIGFVPDTNQTIWMRETRRVVEDVEYLDTLFIEECGDTIWATDYVNGDTMHYVLMVQPLISGQQWGSWEVIGIEDITVPAGTFTDCAVVNHYDEYIYYAPNVGRVKYRTEGYYNMVSVLEVYNVK